jgi:hypothetical protein
MHTPIRSRFSLLFSLFSGLSQLSSWGGGGARGDVSLLPELSVKDKKKTALLLLVRGTVLVQGSTHSRRGGVLPKDQGPDCPRGQASITIYR